jgi:hypothetical protein
VSKTGTFPEGLLARNAGVLLSPNLNSGILIATPLYSAAIKILKARKFPPSTRRFYKGN